MPDAPIRYSVHDPDFNPRLGARLRICLDGIQQERVISYDIAKGMIVRHVVDEHGHPVINVERDAIQTEEVYGAVAVTIDAQPSASTEG